MNGSITITVTFFSIDPADNSSYTRGYRKAVFTWTHTYRGFQTDSMSAIIFMIVYGEIEGEGTLKTPGKKQDV
jgi:hypothetical protein